MFFFFCHIFLLTSLQKIIFKKIHKPFPNFSHIYRRGTVNKTNAKMHTCKYIVKEKGKNNIKSNFMSIVSERFQSASFFIHKSKKMAPYLIKGVWILLQVVHYFFPWHIGRKLIQPHFRTWRCNTFLFHCNALKCSCQDHFNKSDIISRT